MVSHNTFAQCKRMQFYAGGLILLYLKRKHQKIAYYFLVLLKIVSVIASIFFCVLAFGGYIKQLSTIGWTIVIVIMVLDNIFLFLCPETLKAKDLLKQAKRVIITHFKKEDNK